MNGQFFAQEAASRALADVQARIEAACRSAGRPVGSVSLLAVSKTFPAQAVLAVHQAGQTAFGENYLQEALDKQAQLAELAAQAALEWHFIGPIQSNKSRPIAESFTWVHSVDRLRIAKRLSDQRPAALAPLQICLQVNIDEEATKSGCLPADAVALALEIAALPRLRLRGLMAIPAASDEPQIQQAAFARVAALAETIRAALPEPARAVFDTLSMGMSGDLEAAIAEGATIVRVGTALFGHRERKG